MIGNPKARHLFDFIARHDLSVRSVADAADVSEGGLRSFRDVPGRMPNVSTRVRIASALHLLTQEKIYLNSLFGMDGQASEARVYSDEINRDYNKNLSKLLSERGIRPIDLAKNAKVGVDRVVELLRNQFLDDDSVLKIADYLGVPPDSIGFVPARMRGLYRNSDPELPEQRDGLLFDRQDLSRMRSVADILYFYGGLGEGILDADDQYPAPVERTLSLIANHDSGLGRNFTPQRLYHLYVIRDQLNAEIGRMTSPPLADHIRLVLPGLIEMREDRKHSTTIYSPDGHIYVRHASSELVSIGSPEHWECNSPEWLSRVLEGIEFCATRTEFIVMTDLVRESELAQVYLDRGWQKSDQDVSGYGFVLTSVAHP